MSGDIEDFLRRAAQRRQARQGNAAQPPAVPPRRPEYSDARRERTVRPQDDDSEDLVVADEVQEPLAKRIAELQRSQAEAEASRQRERQGSTARRDEVGRSRQPPPSSRNPSRGDAASSSTDRRSQSARLSRSSQSRDSTSPPQPTRPVEPSHSGVSGELAKRGPVAQSAEDAAPQPQLVSELLQSLRSPDGLRSAILHREILDRPVHRW